MTVQEFIDKLKEYPKDKEVIITGYLPEYVYQTKIISWTETEDNLQILTDIEK